MSFKITVTLVTFLVISHVCIQTEAQEPGNTGENDLPSGLEGPPEGPPDGPADESKSSDGPGDEDGPGQRLFLGSLLSTQRVTCDYSTQAGASCVSCNQRLLCKRGNRGYLSTCRGLLRHCTDGRCTYRQSDACAAAAATTTEAAATTTQAAATTTQAAATTTQAAATTTQAAATTTQAAATTTQAAATTTQAADTTTGGSSG